MIVSVVSPVYNAEKTLDALIALVSKSILELGFDFEIILVDDYSKDKSWEKIQSYCCESTKVKGVKLSRNFGQHYAITAGLDYTSGDYIVVMDCDLQDKPQEITRLLNKALEGYDIVLANRYKRKDKVFKKFLSSMFYRVLSYLSGSKYNPGVANFGVYHSTVIDVIKKMREPIRYFPTMVAWVGFNSITMDVDHEERKEGESNYDLRKLLNLALDIILAYSDKPIRIMIKVGIAMLILSMFMAFYTFLKWLFGGVEVLGFSSLMISMWMLCGMIIAMIGMVGLYVGKTFEGIKGRPIYIVEKTENIED